MKNVYIHILFTPTHTERHTELLTEHFADIGLNVDILEVLVCVRVIETQGAV